MLFFDSVVKRVVNFPIQSYDRNKGDMLGFFNNNEMFKLAILISSRSLYEDIKKNKTEKVLLSLERYFLRSHFNPTPFGAFSSVGSLIWSDITLIEKGLSTELEIDYDNSFISGIVKELSLNQQNEFSYFSNPSIHFLNENRISFYRSKILNSGKIEINYVEIDYDENLEWLINKFTSGAKISSLLEELINEGFEKYEIETYLDDIVEAGLLIHEFLYYPLKGKLCTLLGVNDSILVEKKKFNLGNISEITKFSELLKREQDNYVTYNVDNVKSFHAINSFEFGSGSIDVEIRKKIEKFIDFSISYNSSGTPCNDRLNKFGRQLSSRFNDGFIPLSEVFNPYSGIKYSDMRSESQMKLHKDIIAKILRSNEKELFLDLDSKDRVNLNTNLPASFSVVLEVLVSKTTGEEVVYFKKAGGTSALNLISRFGNVTDSLCEEIVSFEKEINADKIIAEVNCMGDLRTINISPTRHYYDYTIPINTSVLKNTIPIFFSDIYIHLQNGKISLVSKEFKKQILPKFISAVNFRLSDSDINWFLREVEFQNQEFYFINFNFNSYENMLREYVPRIYLEKGMLLSAAQLLLVNNEMSFNEFLDYLKALIEKHSFAKKIVFKDVKGDLIVDTENGGHVLAFFNKIQDKKYFYVSECLYDSFYPKIANKSGNFAHEIVVAVKNTEYIPNKINYRDLDVVSNRYSRETLINDWLYIELYCNSYADSDILKYVHQNIILKDICDQFFFIHYGSPERHLRLRFKTSSLENRQYITSVINYLKIKGYASKYHISPYVPENHRYGGGKLMKLAEVIFDLDSKDFLNNVIAKDLEEEAIQIVAILKIKYYLDFMGLSLEEMISYCENCINKFSKEFELNRELRKDFNKKYAKIKLKITDFNYQSLFTDEKFISNIFNGLEKSSLSKRTYFSLLIHMSMNRHFIEDSRFYEFKSYYLAKCYLNQIKYTEVMVSI
ncbi:lantibiotic dehydratase [Flavobacterium sp. ov086]|uniref:lantibiotic dehydratase n=1 Tax=Flavobacterium sp. ov086 TaxID=1761785 RepID=UPI000B6A3EAE|nr:lantibiotic dehydratase [Flavobacterium sp. ov086]SNR23524.1 thiopeptide-type bacteriocin biosynthesis domain-containing protein [Flavobacterium sp. ov086]